MSMLIIADDLSGAADCAIGFANAGYRTVVTLDVPAQGLDATAADVIAADTDTRRLTPAEAAQRTSAAWQALREPGRRLYKKIDSTLRGNWAAEVAALQPLAGLAIVAPAFPATGRTVLGGRVFVRGEPLETTDTWQLENAGRTADLHAMLAQAGVSTAQLDVDALRESSQTLIARIAAVAASGTEALVVDAETKDDLIALARTTAQMDDALFWVGSGGLAREIASVESLFAPRAARTDAVASQRQPRHAPVLVLVGSLSAVSERQCAMLRERAGMLELTVPPAVLRGGERHADVPQWQARIGDALRTGADLLLRIGSDDAFDPAEGAVLSAALAALVKPHFATLGGLIATGGETARAMLSAVGVGSVELIAEIEAGVAVGKPIGTSICPPHLRIVTKAGAFGTDHALFAAWRYLRETPAASVSAGARSHGSA
ncbi:four-carbon acid sugar kinase family protein [Burkholderia multivorans]|uniref:four-carbon acid sugar kinase family protein n=1 Tax=Burkholderia multivorans TaxID=87883 RepID=UPI002018F3AF|nr:four-carbon acid sugar kinase family protein [Burkholderia multivorans]MCO1370414.1 four-carbon acid sugar kinase family protein [Burkholderia multivorans]MCO1459712.1 four-carbon acid sugar kinase family protein [Burkholderia multivorans]MCO1467321.1 four-carbon acid sugar kinase family protein [Burkholderia multivorans]UQO20977.1 four-carbon acid sugar kinase family protein [Burkholderia multivorans]UQO84146.1 four-carbon acid sugar kinase family protein [Burkholderia multivorans]